MNIIHNLVIRMLTHTAVDTDGRNVVLLQVCHLVFHQGYQRRDDISQPFLHQSRHLEADGFSRTGRQYGEAVPAAENRIHDVPLSGAKAVIAEPFF